MIYYRIIRFFFYLKLDWTFFGVNSSLTVVGTEMLFPKCLSMEYVKMKLARARMSLISRTTKLFLFIEKWKWRCNKRKWKVRIIDDECEHIIVASQ